MMIMRLPTAGHALALSSNVPLRSAAFQLTTSTPPAWRDDIPNALTMARVAAIPLLACTFYSGRAALAHVPAAIFAACAFTDWLDGYLARKWNVDSAFGAFLDPVADKLLVCACLVLLSGAMGALVALPTAVIVCREVSVSALREWMGQRGERAAVAVGYAGKVKTAAQMLALQLLLFTDYLSISVTSAVQCPAFGSFFTTPLYAVVGVATAFKTSVCIAPLRMVGLVLLYVAALLSCTSAMGYFEIAWATLLREERASQDGRPEAAANT